jgi:YesN/AraC family two-component response regulator
MARVLIGDDHDVVRMGLRSIVEAQLNFEVVAEAADGKRQFSKPSKQSPISQ